MKKVLLTHAGGRLGIGVARALQQASQPIRIVGVDTNPWQLHRAVADERHLVPRADDPAYRDVLLQIIDETRAQMLWPNHEAEIEVIAGFSDWHSARTFLPDHDAIILCRDKMRTHLVCSQAGVPVPRSMPVNRPEDLDEAFATLGPSLWIRSTQGAGGKGSLPADDADTARSWIEVHHGWGRFMAAERLGPDSATWESVWRRGELLVAQGRRRLYWELSSLTLSGVTGMTGAYGWISDRALDDLAIRAVKAVARVPHGLFCVDVTYDRNGRPRVTEINCGRFMSSGAINAAGLGCNMPQIALLAAFEELPRPWKTLLNPHPQDSFIVHGVDSEPVVAWDREIGSLNSALERRLAALGGTSSGPAAFTDRAKS